MSKGCLSTRALWAGRLSASAPLNPASVPNSRLDRQTFNLTGTFDPFKHLTIDARANYILEQTQNWPILSDGAGNANFSVAFLPTSLDVRDLRGPNSNGTLTNGNEFTFNTGDLYQPLFLPLISL